MSKADGEVKAMDTSWNALSSLEPDAQRRVLTWLADKLGLSESIPATRDEGSVATHQHTANTGTGSPSTATPKQFMAQKKPRTDAERITCLAYFITQHRQTQQFKTKALTDLNREAAGLPFSNAAVAVNNAALSGYLAAAGGGAKQITSRGEALVEALPDRERVKAAMNENPPRKRRVRQKKRTTRRHDN